LCKPSQTEDLRGGPLDRLMHPVPRQQLGDALCRMIVQASQYVSESCLGIDVIELGGLCRAPNYAERLSEQPAVCRELRPVERMSPRFHSA
jgi:hypothetical protein